MWLAGLDAVLRVESPDRRRCGAAVAFRAVLTVLAGDPPPTPDRIESAVHDLLHDADLDAASAMFQVFRRELTPVDVALAILAEFGAVDDDLRLTPLGCWAGERLRERAGELLRAAVAATPVQRVAAVDAVIGLDDLTGDRVCAGCVGPGRRRGRLSRDVRARWAGGAAAQRASRGGRAAGGSGRAV